MKSKCLNCGTELIGKFCHHCGQSAKVRKITFKETVEGFLSSAFALEGQLLSSIKLLISNPGRFFRAFLAGQRKTYYQPVAFFIVTTAAYILIRKIIGYDPLSGQISPIKDGMPELQILSLKAARFMVDNINNIMFTLAFSIGLVLKIFYQKRNNLAEFTTIGFYITGIYTLAGIIFMLTFHYSGYRQNSLQMFFLLLYLTYCFRSYFQLSTFWNQVKYVIASICSVFAYVLMGFGLSMIIVWVLNG